MGMSSPTLPEPGRPQRELLVSKGWLQAVALVVLFGFFVLGLLAYRTYTEQPPIPERVVDPAGETIYTRDDVMAGQKVFLRNGLMEYGSIFGHGAYLGPDYTAEYLHNAAERVLDSYGGPRSDRARTRTIEDFQTNRYDEDERHARVHRGAGGRLRGAPGRLPRVLLQPDDRVRAAAPGDRRRGRDPRADRVLQLVGVDRRRRAGPATTTRTRTAGRPSRSSTTSRART